MQILSNELNIKPLSLFNDLSFCKYAIFLYNLILSTNLSIFHLDDHYHSKEVANNRVALLHTIEKPSLSDTRSGFMKMGGKEWQWQESFEVGASKELIKYEILIREKGANQYSYKSEGFLVNEQ